MVGNFPLSFYLGKYVVPGTIEKVLLEQHEAAVAATSSGLHPR